MATDERFPYLNDEIETETLKGNYPLPQDSEWQTLYLSAGKKDKINKIDIVGLFLKKGNLKPDEIGLIEVQDNSSYVAIKRSETTRLLKELRNEKIKNRKIKIEVSM